MVLANLNFKHKMMEHGLFMMIQKAVIYMQQTLLKIT